MKKILLSIAGGILVVLLVLASILFLRNDLSNTSKLDQEKSRYCASTVRRWAADSLSTVPSPKVARVLWSWQSSL